jgi:hypothetical protein
VIFLGAIPPGGCPHLSANDYPLCTVYTFTNKESVGVVVEAIANNGF